jgi:hypothetical protein
MQNYELFYLIKSIHGPLAGLTFVLVILSDLYASTWVVGWQKKLNSKILKFLHIVVYVGLGGLILTGLSMVVLNSEEFLTNIYFWIKMFFVAVLFWNAGRIGKEMDLPVGKSFTELSFEQKKHSVVVGITSIISWVSALILAGML